MKKYDKIKCPILKTKNIKIAKNESIKSKLLLNFPSLSSLQILKENSGN